MTTPAQNLQNTVTWKLRVLLIVPSLVWVLVGRWLFNNYIFWPMFMVVFFGPILISKQLRDSLYHAQGDPVNKYFRLTVEVPTTVWFCIRFPGYWWIGLIMLVVLLLNLSAPRLERRSAKLASRKQQSDA
jgi:hypothetical protein